MKPWQVGSAVAFGFAALVSSAISLPTHASGAADVSWLSDYGAAQAIARQAGKLLFVAFR